MKVLIVFDSFFGNTEQVARAMAEAVQSSAEVTVLRVDDATPQQVDGTDLLIVGSPTRAFSPSPKTQQFLKSIGRGGLNGKAVAAFDTRIALEDIDNRFLLFMAKRFGYAAGSLDKRLRRKKGRLLCPAEGFIVKDSEGPLKDGELDRAAQWAQTLIPRV